MILNTEDGRAIDHEDILVFLDNLRESGETNMFGAGPYVQDEFELTKQDADLMVGIWMRTFEERHPQ